WPGRSWWTRPRAGGGRPSRPGLVSSRGAGSPAGLRTLETLGGAVGDDVEEDVRDTVSIVGAGTQLSGFLPQLGGDGRPVRGEVLGADLLRCQQLGRGHGVQCVGRGTPHPHVLSEFGIIAVPPI